MPHQNSSLPLVSILMSSYNNASDLASAIDSVLSQTYTNWELVVSDDGSSDQSRTMIDAYHDPRIKKFHTDINQGIVAQYNKLLNIATGDFITLLDADDFIAPTKIELQVNAFLTNPQLAVVWTGVANCDEHGQITHFKKNYPTTDRDIRNFIQKKQGIPCGNLASMMYRRNSALKVGGYQAVFKNMGSWDVDLCLRLLEQGSVCAIPELLYYWRTNVHSFSRKVSLNVLRNQSHRVAYFLRDQRKKFNGIDDCTNLQSGQLDQFIQSIKAEYDQDPSKIHREICKASHLQRELRLEHGMKAIKLNPWNLTNYRYYLRAWWGK